MNILISLQIHHPRLSYLPFLLPRLHAFYNHILINPDVIPYDGWFSFEDVPLKWQYPLGLLYDLFSGASPSQGSGSSASDHESAEEQEGKLPWRLTLHFSEWPEQALVRLDAEGKMLHDAFINSVKEADFLRNGTAKGIMSLSKDDSTQLWNAVQERTTWTIPSSHVADVYVTDCRSTRRFQCFHSDFETAFVCSRCSATPYTSENLPAFLANSF